MGVSIAVGTVLGASTLSFYEEPGDHIVNLAYGAGIGAVAGMGFLLYKAFSGQSSNNVKKDHRSDHVRFAQAPGGSLIQAPSDGMRSRQLSQKLSSRTIWTPVVSLAF